MEIVCERFTTSKLQNFDDLKSIETFGFRGEALASISHVALLTITTKTAEEKCAYKASYIDSKLKGAPKPCAGNQGTTILIENLFYNVATRRKALSSAAEEFTKIADVVTRYSVHNPKVGFTLKKQGEVLPQVRTPHNSTKMNNVKLLYGNPVARELLEVEAENDSYKFKIHALITNPNYTSKRMTFLLFINNRLVDSTPIRKMVEELYSIYLPKKMHPWCYISLDINPNNVDVNVHPTKHEVRFLHEDVIIEKIKIILDEKLSSNNASRTFYLQARMPQVNITKGTLEEVLPEFDKDNGESTKKIHAREMIRTSSSDQKLDKFNFTVHSDRAKGSQNTSRDLDSDKECNISVDPKDFETELQNEHCTITTACGISTNSARDNIVDVEKIRSTENIEKSRDECVLKQTDTEKNSNAFSMIEINLENMDDVLLTMIEDGLEKTNQKKNKATRILLPKETPKDIESLTNQDKSNWSNLISDTTSIDSLEMGMKASDNVVTSTQTEKIDTSSILDPPNAEDDSSSDVPSEPVPISEAADRALKIVYKYYGTQENIESSSKRCENFQESDVENETVQRKNIAASEADTISSSEGTITPVSSGFKSYSVNKFRIQVKLHSILTLRKEIEDNYHEGLRDILSNIIFVGSVDEKSALVQSGLNLYICDTMKLAEELFYEIMLYDFENYGVFKFSQPLPLDELALLGLETEGTGWTEEDGPKDEIAARVKELLLEKADLLNDYFSINIDKRGNIKSLPVLLDKYIPYEAELPLYILRLATEVDWTAEKVCFDGICRETAKFYSHVNTSNEAQDWKHVVEHVLYPAIKESLLPPKCFAHDSTILQIASLPDLYKVFERC
ncbi:DNA mismatch repair protein Mlh1 isoform X2 [Venturia canescens]|nr:DNA mismatch repair protein Mlh1 isoform X2 [Venturia canescens]XP_043272191.1 DNA mismatch repair protein Mlh1 isoform X2 [Venturia canescens]